ncbi:hypothetical protein GCM10025781_27120 [Kocuria gwangalliensis]|uniref:Uncharacterized protein n=1 Tax=Kocuria gwangalliensis TaxID=501592 RepID=A0ABP8XJL5_9MICC
MPDRGQYQASRLDGPRQPAYTAHTGTATPLPPKRRWIYSMPQWRTVMMKRWPLGLFDIPCWVTPAEVFAQQLRSVQQPGVATTG